MANHTRTAFRGTRKKHGRKPGWSKKHKHQPLKSATDLAALAKCERQAMYDHEEAPRLTRGGNGEARARGKAAHRQRHQQLMASENSRPLTGKLGQDKRCFIATAVYGPDAWQTDMLRDWRDTVLVRHAWGRMVVAIYYRTSPAIARRLNSHPGLRATVRRLLDGWVDHVERKVRTPWQN